MTMENPFGFAAVDPPQVGRFTIEDFIYLISPIVWWFPLPCSLGCLLWTPWEYRAWNHNRR